MALFSTANARSFALKSVERRKQLALQRYEPAAPESLPAGNGASKVASDTLEEIKTVLGRLSREPGMAPDKLDLLTRSLERLWKIHAHAGGIPLVAPRKEKRRNSGETIELIPTIDLLPDPEIAINDKVPNLETVSHPDTVSAVVSPNIQAPIVQDVGLASPGTMPDIDLDLDREDPLD